MTTFIEIEAAALRLSPQDRERLVERLAATLQVGGETSPQEGVDSFDCTDEDIAGMRRSIEQLERGEGRPAEEVFRELRAELLAMQAGEARSKR